MEQQLREMDFSRFSKERGRLKENLLASYKQGVQLLEDDELDRVVAAGGMPLSEERRKNT